VDVNVSTEIGLDFEHVVAGIPPVQRSIDAFSEMRSIADNVCIHVTQEQEERAKTGFLIAPFGREAVRGGGAVKS
jgi:hypothetical protein